MPTLGLDAPLRPTAHRDRLRSSPWLDMQLTPAEHLGGMRVNVTLALLLLLLAAGCGSSRNGTLLVAVSNPSGLPVSGANVAVYGTSLRGATDASGNARISGIAPGVYLVTVTKAGYYRAADRETITRKSDEQLAVTLNYVPPLGTFWRWTGQNQNAVEVLSVTGTQPLTATALTYQQVCKAEYKLVTPPPPPPGWAPQQPYYEQSGGTWSWQRHTQDETDTVNLLGTAVVGPRQLGSGWHRGSAPITPGKTWGACKP